MATPKTVQSLAGGKWKIDDTGNLIKIGGVLVSDHVGAAIGVGAGGTGAAGCILITEFV